MHRNNKIFSVKAIELFHLKQRVRGRIIEGVRGTINKIRVDEK